MANRTTSTRGPQWWLKVASLESIHLRWPFKVSRVILDLTPANMERAVRKGSRQEKQPLSLIWALPPLVREEDLPWLGRAIEELRRQGAQGFQIGHIGQLPLFGTANQERVPPGVEIYGDYSCNVLNTPALYEYGRVGLSGVQVSLEIERATLQQMQIHRFQALSMGGSPTMRLGVYVFGYPPLFTARIDAPHFQGQRSFCSGRGERYSLERRPEAICARSASAYSLLAHVHELSHIGVDYFVVDVSHGPPKKTASEVLALFAGRGELPPYFSGNYSGSLL